MSPMMNYVYTENKYSDPLINKKIVFKRMNYQRWDPEKSKAKTDFDKYKKVSKSIKEQQNQNRKNWEIIEKKAKSVERSLNNELLQVKKQI